MAILFVFMQEKDPKHKSKLAMVCFYKEHIPILDWPEQSSELNSIRNPWNDVECTIA